MCAPYRELHAGFLNVCFTSQLIKALGVSECSGLQVMRLQGALGFALYAQVWSAHCLV